MIRTKSIFSSKTFWANILMSVGAVAATNVIPPKYAVPVAGIVNIGLRFLTTAPVAIIGE